MQLRGKAAVVTGAARGIGLEIARVLLKNGAKVSSVSSNDMPPYLWVVQFGGEGFWKSYILLRGQRVCRGKTPSFPVLPS